MAKLSGKILVVDDDEDVLVSARLFLKQHFNFVETENNPERLTEELRGQEYDVVLLDMNFTAGATAGKEGLHWLHKVLENDASMPVVLMTAFGDIDLAVQAIKEGAADFVLKPWQNQKLLSTLTAAMRLRQSRMEVKQLKNQQKQLNEYIDKDFSLFLGQSAAMIRVFETIDKVAGTDASVLVMGENGTGKELVARALHRKSGRNGLPLVTVDLGAVPPTLFESELFGHVKGSFTDAVQDRAGRFEIAHKGTLFLDEIGNIPMYLQSKLLSVLQNRQVQRVGSNKLNDIDIRLISATNMPLHAMVNEQKFRQDLLYRINTVEIHLPPLRERREDIELLARHYLEQYIQKYHKPKASLSAAARKALEQYAWPGNVRELQHAMERAVILSASTTLQPEDFAFLAVQTHAQNMMPEDLNLDKLEKQAVKESLTRNGGNISQAAKELGLTRAALYRRIEKYGI